MDKQLVVSSDPSNDNETENIFLNHLEGANKKLRLAPTESEQQLNLTPNRLESVANAINFNPGSSESEPKHQTTKLLPYSQQPLSERLKVSTFSASSIKIGNWKRTSRTKDDLVAKFYFGTKRILWEFLEEALKIKIEMKWSDIIGMRAVIKENEPGILEIELSNPPTFYEDNDPDPRKHPRWKPISDFTTGEASLHRRHLITLPPGSLEKHYERLLQCDRWLLRSTQLPFPRLQSPHFSKHRSRVPNVNPGFQNPSVPPTFVSPDRVASCQRAIQASLKETTSSASVMDFSNPSDEYQYHPIRSQISDDQSIPVLAGQGISCNYTSSKPANFPPFHKHQNYDTSNHISNKIYEGQSIPVLPGQASSSNYVSERLGTFPAVPTHQNYGTRNLIRNQTYEDQSIPALAGQGIVSNYTSAKLAHFAPFPKHQNYDTTNHFSNKMIGQGITSNYTRETLGNFPAVPTHQNYGTINLIRNQTYAVQSIPVLPGQGISNNYIPAHRKYDTQQPSGQGSMQVLEYVPQPFDQVGMPNYDHRLTPLTGISSEAYNADENFAYNLWGQADEFGGTYNVLESLGYPPPTPSDQSLPGEDSSFTPVASDASTQDFGQGNHFHGTNY